MPFRVPLVTIAAVVVWYTTAAISAIQTKLAVNAARDAAFAIAVSTVAGVCAANMLALSGAAIIGLWLRGHTLSDIVAAATLVQVPALPPTLFLEHAIGHASATAAVVFADATVVQTLKATEPVFVVLVNGDTAELSTRKVTSILLVIGAGLACGGLQMGPALFSVAGELGIALAIISNIAFALRNAGTKKLSTSSDSVKKAANHDHGDSLMVLVSASVAATLGFAGITAAAVAAAPTSAVLHILSRDFLFATAASSLGFATYQIASSVVLENVSPVTHALVNVGKRVFIVVATAILSGKHLSPLAVAAFAVMIVGLCLHSDTVVGAVTGGGGKSRKE